MWADSCSMPTWWTAGVYKMDVPLGPMSHQCPVPGSGRLNVSERRYASRPVFRGRVPALSYTYAVHAPCIVILR